jgi:glutaredoxin
MPEFITPKSMTFTVYSKSGCNNCIKVKDHFNQHKLLFDEVNCDNYLNECKTEFLEFIKNLAGKDVKTFPMVFDAHHFIGGYKETLIYCENMLDIIF